MCSKLEMVQLLLRGVKTVMARFLSALSLCGCVCVCVCVCVKLPARIRLPLAAAATAAVTLPLQDGFNLALCLGRDINYTSKVGLWVSS